MLRRAAAAWSRLGAGWRLSLALLVALRIGLGLVSLIAVQPEPEAFRPQGNWAELMIRGGAPWKLLLSTWQRWDALWYQQIAEHGYHAGDGTTAFYPLYPFLARAVSLLLGGQVVPAELLVSSAAFAVAMW